MNWSNCGVSSSGQWTPGGVKGDNVVNGDSSSGNQSWGNSFVTCVAFTRSDGDQSGLVRGSSSSGNVLRRGNSGNSSNRSDGRELHF